jgi:Co/Zn/Cd efflux system component
MGWVWLDPAMGIVGALVIARWAYGLLRDTSKILLDRDADLEVTDKIHSIIESDADNRIADFHLWKINSNKFALVLSIVTHYPKPPGYYKALLNGLTNLSHVTVEVHAAEGLPCLNPPLAKG